MKKVDLNNLEDFSVIANFLRLLDRTGLQTSIATFRRNPILIVEDLDVTLKQVTFNDKKIKLWR